MVEKENSMSFVRAVWDLLSAIFLYSVVMYIGRDWIPQLALFWIIWFAVSKGGDK